MVFIQKVIAFVIVFAGAGTAIAQAPPPIEAYGELPSIRSVTISPDGEHYAFLLSEGELEKLAVFKMGEGAIGAVNTANIKARSIEFFSNEHIILRASRTINSVYVRNEYEHSGAYSLNISEFKIHQLLNKADGLYFAQSGLGRIIGSHTDENTVLMPAYTGSGRHPPYSLLRVKLRAQDAHSFARGTSDTIDWFVTPDGTRIIREELDDSKNSYAIQVKSSGRWETIFEDEDASSPPINLMGFNPGGDALIIAYEDENGLSALYELGFDGTISDAIISQEGKQIESVILDRNRIIHGVRYAGLQPEHEMFDASLTVSIRRIEEQFSGNSVFIESWTDDWSKVILFVTGGDTAGMYLILDTSNVSLLKIGAARARVSDNEVAVINKIEYQARDGLALNGILTMPSGPQALSNNSPMIVMPHGGPASHDTIRFDYLAQYFASRGYLIFQPNFRGSTGFGDDFLAAGDGEWGGKMQDDITDGVEGIIEAGLADRERICIMGASYGGYAALAGGAFTPDLYKCVISIAGVSDLPKMLIDERRQHGKNDWAYEYWERVIGDPREQREKLRSVSPLTMPISSRQRSC